MLVACPGCSEPLKMPTAVSPQDDTAPDAVPGTLHKCSILGVMPDPHDPAALMLWMSGSLTPQSPPLRVSPVSATLQKKKPKTRSSHQHVPYDSTYCTKDGCNVWGKVPGVRRHIGFMHPDEAEELLAKMPPNRTIDGLINAFEGDEVAATALIESMGMAERFPTKSDEWSWEDVAAAMLNKLEEKG